MRYNNVLEFLIDLHDLELHSLAYKDVVVADGFYIDLRAGEECLDTEHVNNHTALGSALDVTLDDFIVFKSLIYALP